MMIHIGGEDVSASQSFQDEVLRVLKWSSTHSTGPKESTLAFVSALNGVEATTHTPPPESLMAVDRPPIGKNP